MPTESDFQYSNPINLFFLPNASKTLMSRRWWSSRDVVGIKVALVLSRRYTHRSLGCLTRNRILQTCPHSTQADGETGQNLKRKESGSVGEPEKWLQRRGEALEEWRNKRGFYHSTHFKPFFLQLLQKLLSPSLRSHSSFNLTMMSLAQRLPLHMG